MNYSTVLNQNSSYPNNTIGDLFHNLSYSQFIGIIIAGPSLILSIAVLIFLIIYQKYRSRINKLNNVGLTSNNPCYVGSSMSQFGSNSGHAHCNMSVSTDFYDIDDLNALDNDSFLNSLENAIFVGYLNHSQPKSIHSSVHINPATNTERVQSAQLCSTSSSRHSYKKSAPPRYSGSNSSVKLRTGKSKRSINKTANPQDSIRIRAKSETISESIGGSTSNLITSSKMFLADSNDSVCNSSKNSHQLTEALAAGSCETNVDQKAESSTDSHTSVNSTSAMMSAYSADKATTSQCLPDLVNSTLPRSSKQLKRASSVYPNSFNRDEASTQSTGQILDPLKVGQQHVQFINNIAHPASNLHRHERHFSYNITLPNTGLFEYNIPG